MTDTTKKTKLKTRAKVKHPLLEGKDRKVWHPELAGVVPHYAKTLAIFEARQAHGRKIIAAVRASGRRFDRLGVPDGGARRREGVLSFRALARHEAARIMDHLRKEGLLLEPDNDLANEALMVAVEIHRDKLSPGPLRLAASKVVMEWTRAKPASKVETTIRTAESFLDDLAEASLPNARGR